MMRRFGGGASGSPGLSYTTLNPADMASDVTLSGGNLIADFGVASWQAVRAIAPKSAGKFYFEVKVLAVGASTARGAGILQAGHTLTGYIGSQATGWGHLSDGYRTNSGYTIYGDAWESQNDVLMVAVDLDAGKIWFGKNGTWIASGNPAAGANAAFTNVSGTVYPAVCAKNENARLGLNFGASAFAYSPPSGFTGWTA